MFQKYAPPAPHRVQETVQRSKERADVQSAELTKSNSWKDRPVMEWMEPLRMERAVLMFFATWNLLVVDGRYEINISILILQGVVDNPFNTPTLRWCFL